MFGNKGKKTNEDGTVDKSKKVAMVQWIIAAVLLIGVIFVALIGVITDYLWFNELGYVSVFFTKLVAMLQIGIPTFAVVLILSYIYLKTLKRGYCKKLASEISKDDKRKINKITWVVSAVAGLVVSVIFTRSLWFQLLQVLNSSDFGTDDPIFNLDISFYVFQLDFWAQLNNLMIVFIGIYVLMTVVYYIILMSFGKPETSTQSTPFDEEEETFSGSDFKEEKAKNPFENSPLGSVVGKFFEGMTGKGPQRKPSSTGQESIINGVLEIAKVQVGVLGALFFLMLGANFFLRQFSLLLGSNGTVYGAGYTDANVTLWMYRVLIGLALVGVVAVIISVKKNRLKPIVVTFLLMVVTGVVGMGAEVGVQKLIVTPDEISKESEYLEYNIEFTQSAYDLQEVTIKPFSADNTLTSEDIANNSETIDNIRINDYTPAKQFYNQTQSIRPYYTFNDVDVDRYTIDGEYTQTFLSTREIDEDKVTDTWLNRHIKYTHGYGIVMSRVNEVTASGQPNMIVDSIPPVSTAPEIEITRPEIYFGELSNNYSVVGTNETEFDYPDGDTNQYTEYEGSAGIKMTLLNRIMFAIEERSLNLLVSSNITSTSKIIVNKNIMERVNKIMPYLQYENDPYMVVDEGKLYWIIDAYTTSDKYPYSQPYDTENAGATNYIRNSIKVVVDAYNGDVNYYIVDKEDPIAMTLQSIYPDLFKNGDEMPEGLQSHLRYPAEMLDIQAEVYKRYHMEDVTVFYQNEDIWDISKEIYGTSEEAPMSSNYYILKIPGEDEAEFVNSIPYSPKDKNNMTALLMARNDGEAYGELVLFQLPKGEAVDGPLQIEAKITQDGTISKDFSLWESSGLSYTRGNMFVIPVEESLIYVEPVYLEAANSSIPEVRRVIVVYDDKIAYEETLDEALASLFGEGGQATTPSETTSSEDEGNTTEELIALISDAFEAAQTAAGTGDWDAYGEHMQDVSDYLEDLAK